MYKVLIADDSASTRLALEKIIEKEPEFKIVGVAFDGEEVLRKIEYLKPDVITLDLEMPNLNGLGALEKIMKSNPLPVIVVSSLTPAGAKETITALESGAIDCILKPSLYPLQSTIDFENELITKLKAAVTARMFSLKGDAPNNVGSYHGMPGGKNNFDAVIIGISTGGPSSLKKIIPYLPEHLLVSFIIAQHMPLGLTQSLAENLNSISNIRIKEAREGDIVYQERILIAPAGYQTTLKQRQHGVTIKISDPSKEDLYKPSINLLFASAAKVFKSKVLGIIMTGMGSDGTAGAKVIKEAGGTIIAESEESCVIYGMPKSAIDAGVVDYVLPLNAIVNKIMELVS